MKKIISFISLFITILFFSFGSYAEASNGKYMRYTGDFGETKVINGLEITLIGFRMSKGDNYWGKPKKGNSWVFFEFDVHNISDKEEKLDRVYHFNVYKDGYHVEHASGPVTDEKGELYEKMKAGRRAKGEYGSEVNDDWNTLEIDIEYPSRSGNTITFSVKK